MHSEEFLIKLGDRESDFARVRLPDDTDLYYRPVLYEAANSTLTHNQGPIILKDASLKGLIAPEMYLRRADLKGANLGVADLSHTSKSIGNSCGFERANTCDLIVTDQKTREAIEELLKHRHLFLGSPSE